MCVCVRVFWIYECFAFFLLRDVLESLTCWLNLWLSSLLFAFTSMCFFPSLKTPFLQARQFLDKSSTDSHLSSPFFFFSGQKLTQFRSVEISGVFLDNFSMHRETFCLADRSSIDSRSIEDGFYSIAAWQLLNLSKIFVHALFFTYFASFYYLVIHSILFHYIHAFFMDSFCPLDHL